MKKIIAFLATTIIGSSAIFALSFELDVNYQFGINSSVKPSTVLDTATGDKVEIPKDAREKYSYMTPFGLAVNGNIYFASFNIVDIGLNVGAGFDISNDLTISDDTSKISIRKDVIKPLKDAGFDASFIGIGGFGKIGLATRYNLHEKHSLYFAPAFIIGGETFTRKVADTTGKTKVIYYGLDLDLGYRLWFTDIVGLDLGLNIDAPIGVSISDDASPDIKMKGIGAAFKLYAGVAFNFGK